MEALLTVLVLAGFVAGLALLGWLAARERARVEEARSVFQARFAPPVYSVELVVARVAVAGEEGLEALARALGAPDGPAPGLLLDPLELTAGGDDDPLQALEDHLGDLRLLPLHLPAPPEDADFDRPALAAVVVLHADLPHLLARLSAVRPGSPEAAALPLAAAALLEPLRRSAEAAQELGESLLVLAWTGVG